MADLEEELEAAAEARHHLQQRAAELEAEVRGGLQGQPVAARRFSLPHHSLLPSSLSKCPSELCNRQ